MSSRTDAWKNKQTALITTTTKNQTAQESYALMPTDASAYAGIAYELRNVGAQFQKCLDPVMAECPIWCGSVKRDEHGALVLVDVIVDGKTVKEAVWIIDSARHNRVAQKYRSDAAQGKIPLVDMGNGRMLFPFPYEELINDLAAYLAAMRAGNMRAVLLCADRFASGKVSGMDLATLGGMRMARMIESEVWITTVAMSDAIKKALSAQKRASETNKKATYDAFQTATQAAHDAIKVWRASWVRMHPAQKKSMPSVMSILTALMLVKESPKTASAELSKPDSAPASEQTAPASEQTAPAS